MKILVLISLILPTQTFADTASIFRSFKKEYCENSKSTFKFKKQCIEAKFFEDFEAKLERERKLCVGSSGLAGVMSAIAGAGSASANDKPCEVDHKVANGLIEAYFKGADSVHCDSPTGVYPAPSTRKTEQ